MVEGLMDHVWFRRNFLRSPMPCASSFSGRHVFSRATDPVHLTSYCCTLYLDLWAFRFLTLYSVVRLANWSSGCGVVAPWNMSKERDCRRFEWIALWFFLSVIVCSRFWKRSTSFYFQVISNSVLNLRQSFSKQVPAFCSKCFVKSKILIFDF